MTSRRGKSADRTRLLTQLLVGRSDPGPFSFATDEALAVARSLEPGLVGDLLAAVLGAYAPGGDHRLAQRAAHVAHALKLAAVVPALVGCIERLPQGDPVASVACATLELIGQPAVGPLALAFERAKAPEVRFALGLALTLMPEGDDRVRTALEGLLDRDPDMAAELLGVRGDRRAVPALRAALARLAPPPLGRGAPATLASLVALGEAILSLGGRMTTAERAIFDRACAAVDPAFFEAPRDPRAHLH
jgi:hypothetical protein